MTGIKLSHRDKLKKLAVIIGLWGVMFIYVSQFFGEIAERDGRHLQDVSDAHPSVTRDSNNDIDVI